MRAVLKDTDAGKRVVQIVLQTGSMSEQESVIINTPILWSVQ